MLSQSCFQRCNDVAILAVLSEAVLLGKQRADAYHFENTLKWAHHFCAQLPVRRIVFRDETLNKEFVFTTNRFDWPASLVAQIYKQRWQVELFFKWIKQNLKLKSFVGVSNNAVMTQIMVAGAVKNFV